MVVTTYTCDLCGKEQETPNQFWTLGIGIYKFGYPTYNTAMPEHKKDVCRECLEKRGLLPLPSGVAPAARASFEELLRDIIHEEIEAEKRVTGR